MPDVRNVGAACALAVGPGFALIALASLWAVGVGFFLRSLWDLAAPLLLEDPKWEQRMVLTWGAIFGLGLSAYAVLTAQLGDVPHGLGDAGQDPLVLHGLANALQLCAGATGAMLLLRGIGRLWGQILNWPEEPPMARLLRAGMIISLTLMQYADDTTEVVVVDPERRFSVLDLMAVAVRALLLTICWAGVRGADLCVWHKAVQ